MGHDPQFTPREALAERALFDPVLQRALARINLGENFVEVLAEAALTLSAQVETYKGELVAALSGKPIARAEQEPPTFEDLRIATLTAERDALRLGLSAALREARGASEQVAEAINALEVIRDGVLVFESLRQSWHAIEGVRRNVEAILIASAGGRL